MSPFVSPIDFNTLQQNPTFTNAELTVSTDPAYPGRVVIKFQDSTAIAPASIFIGGDSALGIDPAALQLTQEIPGVGNVPVPMVAVLNAQGQFPIPHVIELQPTGSVYAADINPGLNPQDPNRWQTDLPAGQYTVGVFNNVKNTEGRPLSRGPVFHSFTVVSVADPTDDIAPRVLTSTPVNGEKNVGAGVPPPAGPPGLEDTIVDVTTNVFGPATPDIIVRFTEGIQSVTVTAANFAVVDAGAFVPGGGAPPAIVPAPGFPKLKSADDRETLPSNGHEVIWRADPLFGGFPFGSQVQVTVTGSDGGVNASPITDLAGNVMETSSSFQFQTIAPPDLPQNPFPEYAIWWSASDRCGALDTVNQQGLADQFTGAVAFPLGVPENVVPEFTDTVSTDRNIPNWDPREIVIDTRTNFATCHSWVYVQSAGSGQIGILNSRTSVPVALINTPTPGGIACQTHRNGQSILLVTNASANTITAINVTSQTPGTAFLNGPLFVSHVQPTGNTPRAISISAPSLGGSPDNWNRGTAGFGGPVPELIMYADFTDGVVNTTTLASDFPVRQFALGPSAAPNDIALTPCFSNPPILFGAISQGGQPGEGKVAYYIAGPGCVTGASTGGRPDSIVGDLTGFDAPAGISDTFSPTNDPNLFVVAQSGADAVSTLGLVLGAINLPDVKNTFFNVGDNPTVVTTRPAWLNPCVAFAFNGFNECFHDTTATCIYNGTEQDAIVGNRIDTGQFTATDLYICSQGAGFVKVIDQNSGAESFYNNIAIPGIRFVASTVRQ